MSNITKYGEYIFSTTDPLGREVRLKTSTWQHHVIGTDNNRVELTGEEELIKSIVENPYYIIKNDPKKPNGTREKYLDFVQLQAFSSLKNLVIVVDHKDGFGDIVTVIPKNDLKKESAKGGAIYVRGKSTT